MYFNLLLLIGCPFTLVNPPVSREEEYKTKCSLQYCDTYKSTLGDLATVEFDFLISILTTQEIMAEHQDLTVVMNQSEKKEKELHLVVDSLSGCKHKNCGYNDNLVVDNEKGNDQNITIECKEVVSEHQHLKAVMMQTDTTEEKPQLIANFLSVFNDSSFDSKDKIAFEDEHNIMVHTDEMEEEPHLVSNFLSFYKDKIAFGDENNIMMQTDLTEEEPHLVANFPSFYKNKIAVEDGKNSMVQNVSTEEEPHFMANFLSFFKENIAVGDENIIMVHSDETGEEPHYIANFLSFFNERSCDSEDKNAGQDDAGEKVEHRDRCFRLYDKVWRSQQKQVIDKGRGDIVP